MIYGVFQGRDVEVSWLVEGLGRMFGLIDRRCIYRRHWDILFFLPSIHPSIHCTPFTTNKKSFFCKDYNPSIPLKHTRSQNHHEAPQRPHHRFTRPSTGNHRRIRPPLLRPNLRRKSSRHRLPTRNPRPKGPQQRKHNQCLLRQIRRSLPRRQKLRETTFLPGQFQGQISGRLGIQCREYDV